MFYQLGTMLRIKDVEGTVIGYIEYSNPADSGKTWIEYRLRTNQGERWLSCDEFYNEYSISWPANEIKGRIGPEWHKVDEGTQIVGRYGGSVDVDPGERASFVEYEDATEERTLSVEMWSDGTEYSHGYYVDAEEIVVTGMSKVPMSNGSKSLLTFFIIYGSIFVAMFGLSFISSIAGAINSGKQIERFLKKSSSFVYETSITGEQKQKASVYRYSSEMLPETDTDSVAKLIINGIEGNTESVTQKDDAVDETIAIVTKKEYCLIYHPEDDPSVVYVQVSNRKYNYTSDNAPYKSSSSNTTWYRSHYHSSAYSSDSSSFRSSPSAYSMYDGSTVHNIGNGYFDTYSNSVRQSSVSSRSSSSGGISSGK